MNHKEWDEIKKYVPQVTKTILFHMETKAKYVTS